MVKIETNKTIFETDNRNQKINKI